MTKADINQMTARTQLKVGKNYVDLAVKAKTLNQAHLLIRAAFKNIPDSKELRSYLFARPSVLFNHGILLGGLK